MRKIILFSVLILVFLTGGFTADWWGLYGRLLQREKKDTITVEQPHSIPIPDIFVDPMPIPNTIPFPLY